MKKKMTQWVFLVLSLFVCGYTASIGIHTILSYNTFKLELQCAQELLKKEYMLYQQYHAALASVEDPDFWEVEAKVKLDMVKEGERVFRMIPPL